MRVPGLNILSGLLLAAGLALPAHADGVEDFYKDRMVTLITGYSSGGGFDLYARVVANHLGRHIPGQPRIIVQNMPGAGSMRAANHLYNVAPKDGSVIALTRSPVIEPLVGASGAAFDATKFTWLGSGASDLTVCGLLGNPKVSTMADARQTQFTLGGLGPGSDEDMYAKILRKLLGLKIHLVSGYPGGAELILAVERGELDGRCGWAYSSIKSRSRIGSQRRRSSSSTCSRSSAHPSCRTCPPSWSSPPASDRSRSSGSCSTPRRSVARSRRRPAFRRIAPPPCARRSTPPWPTRRCWPR